MKMAQQDPQQAATETSPDNTDNEVLSPATPGAETLGSPDPTPSSSDEAAEADVLTPATPGAETLGSPDSGENATAPDSDVLTPATPGSETFGGSTTA
jgi:hypothetical protein